MIQKILVLLSFLFAHQAHAGELVYIGLDAEFAQKSSTSAQAVQQGIQIAIDEINQAGGVLGGRKLELITRDNRSITAIAVDNLRDLAKIPDLIAVFGGKYSPVYIECIPVAQELQIPLLDPWGSADMITDHGFQPSYTFRLSLKDSWAGPAFVRFAMKQHKAKHLGVLLPNTSWGRSNQAAIDKAAAKAGVKLTGVRWYNWGDPSLIIKYNELRNTGADAIILVANENEGSLLIKEMAALPPEQRLPIISHWGVTGGDFAGMTGDALQKIDFSVIQTYSFIGQKSPIAKRVLAAMQRSYGIAEASQIKSPVGVAHAYDLTHLLARAINQAGSTNRGKIRDAMEKLGPYVGLVQYYAQPFSPDRHDALSDKNIFFSRYTADDKLIPFDQPNY